MDINRANALRYGAYGFTDTATKNEASVEAKSMSEQSTKAQKLSDKGKTVTSEDQQELYAKNTKRERAKAAFLHVVDEMLERGEKSVTPRAVKEYQKELEEDFSKKMRTVTKHLGIDDSVDYTLRMEQDGSISVFSQDEKAKKHIEQFLSESPKVCERFAFLQALKGFDRVLENNPEALRADMMATRSEMQSMLLDDFILNEDFESSFTPIVNAHFTGTKEIATFYSGVNSAV